MIGSNAKRSHSLVMLESLRPLPLAMLVVMTVWTPVAFAQDAIEEGAIEADAPIATAPPLSIIPGPKVPPPAVAIVEGSGEPGDIGDLGNGVQIGALEQPDPSSLGILDDNNGGLGWTLWQGADATLVKKLLVQLPAPLQSPILQDLSRRLLLTPAGVPEALTPPPAGIPEQSLLDIRLDRLAAGGQLQASADLLDRIVPFSVSIDLEQRRADLYLLTHATERACSLADTALQRSGDTYWLQLSAFCRAARGDRDGAYRTMELLYETGDVDPGYAALLSLIISEEKGTLPDNVSLRDPSPLIFSMTQALDIPLNAGILLTSNPLLLPAIAGAENAAPVVRLEALEQAASYGGVSLDVLTAAYRDVAFTSDDKSSALSRVFEGGGATMNALLFQMVLESTDAASRLQYLSAAWDLSRRQGQYALVARVHMDATRSIEPAPAFLANAGDIVRALLMGGATERAFEWYEVVRRSAASDDLAATGTLLDIWPLFHLASSDTGVPYSDQVLSLWWQAQITVVGEERIRRGRLLYSLLEALDYDVPETFWIEVMEAPLRVSDTAPSIAVWRAGLRAAAAGRVGETILASLDGMGNRGLRLSSLSAISSIIGQFRALGLGDEADRIAIETAILRGL